MKLSPPNAPYEPIDECIYCGSQIYAHDSKRFLALEHIIPFGLNGDLELPRSSCRRCERVTGKIEEQILRGTLLGCRAILGLKSRKGKAARIHLPVYSGNVRIMVPIEDYPPMLVAPHFSEPREITGAPEEGSTFDLKVIFFGGDIRVLREKYGIGSWSPPIFPVDSYRRMLGKIAHAFACAELRPGSFEPFLPPIIIGGERDSGRLIGGGLHTGSVEDCLHWLRLESVERGTDILLAVRMRLFAIFSDTSEHLVVAGRLQRHLEQPVTRKVYSVFPGGIAPAPIKGGSFQISLFGR